MTWEKIPLGEFLTLKRGYDLPYSRRKDGEIPIVSSSGITGYHNEAKVDGPGVVTGRYGTLGEIFFVKKDFWPLNTALYVQDFRGNDPRFSAYFLKRVLNGTASDKAAVPGVNRNDLHARKVVVPRDLATQKTISAILSAYDDLIENNRRRIHLLEQAARLLFREWFVYLKFPGHETIRVRNGVPEGWERVPLEEICWDSRETVSPSDIAPETPYIGLEHIPRKSITLCDWDTSENIESNKYQFEEGDILFGKIRPYLHKVGFALNKGVTSSDAIVIRPLESRLYNFSLFLLSNTTFVTLVSKTVREGSKMPRADWKFLQKQMFLLPPQRILSKFDQNVSPIVAQLRTLALQNQKLAQARDLLLPRLMSGEIAV